MTHYITQPMIKMFNFFYDVTAYTFSIPLKLIEKIKTLFASKASAPTGPSTPLTQKTVEVKTNLEVKTQPLTKEEQAAIKIQRWFRNKLGTLEHQATADIIREAREKIRAAKNQLLDVKKIDQTIKAAMDEANTEIDKIKQANSPYADKIKEARTLLKSTVAAGDDAQ
jgi:hypothetical protein